MTSRCDLAEQADTLLRRAHCDTMSGARKDRQYRRNKRAQSKRLGAHQREKRKQLGKFGAASPGRHVAPDDQPQNERSPQGAEHHPTGS